MSRRALLWLIPLFITIHNLEELLTFPAFLQFLPSGLPGWAGALLPDGILPPTERQYLVMLLIVTVLPYLLALLGGARRARGARTFFLVAVQVMMLVNVFSHLWMWNLANGYVPGLVTALAFNLPFSAYLIARGVHEGWLRWADFAYMVPAAVILHGPGLFGLLLIARLFVV
jgi:hypothetical protein